MKSPPILLLGFNRPQKTTRLVNALRVHQPKHVIFNVDGPRVGHPSDEIQVQEVQRCVELIDWPCRVETRFHATNQGLRAAVVSAVSSATSQYGQVIVIEDDTVPGPHLVGYLTAALQHYNDRPEIGHISGYNVVPRSVLKDLPGPSRLSLYPESFAWATWERAWRNYDDSLIWGTTCDLRELAEVTGSITSALRWRINFLDAKSRRIDSWAYRWISSLWSHRMLAVSPNVNLANYGGSDSGTHTRRRPRWQDLPLGNPQEIEDCSSTALHIADIDKWIGRTVFRESLIGLADGLVTSVALEILRRRK